MAQWNTALDRIQDLKEELGWGASGSHMERAMKIARNNQRKEARKKRNG